MPDPRDVCVRCGSTENVNRLGRCPMCQDILDPPRDDEPVLSKADVLSYGAAALVRLNDGESLTNR